MLSGYGTSSGDVSPTTSEPSSSDIVLRFAVAGDSRGSDRGFYDGSDDGTNGRIIQKLLNNAKQLNPQPKFFVGVGDLIAGSPSKIPAEIKAQLTNFRSHFTSVYPIEFFYPGIGNHEIKGSLEGEKAFNESFPEFAANPDVHFLEGYNNTVWYIDHGDARFFYLNSNHPRDSVNNMAEDHTISGRQLEWLKKNIDPSKKHNIYFIHEPAFGTWKAGDNLDRDPYLRNLFWEVVDKSNGPLVFVAHEHLYSRRHINSDFNETVNGKTFKWTKNVYQITAGGFGGPLNGTYTDKKNVDTDPPCIAKYNYVVIDILKDGSYHGRAIDENGKILDQFIQAWQ